MKRDRPQMQILPTHAMKGESPWLHLVAQCLTKGFAPESAELGLRNTGVYNTVLQDRCTRPPQPMSSVVQLPHISTEE